MLGIFTAMLDIPYTYVKLNTMNISIQGDSHGSQKGLLNMLIWAMGHLIICINK